MTIAAAAGAVLSAHRKDELLQAARLGLEPDGVQVELDLTPGIALADAIIADVDRNADGELSPDEQLAYGSLVLGALDVEIDGTPLRLRLSAANFPGPDGMRRGEGIIQLHSAAAIPRLPAGSHRLSFRNRHHRERSVYLANALVPENDQVAVTAQRRDGDQTELIIDFVVRPGPAAVFTGVWVLSSIAAAAVLSALLMRPSRSVR